MERSKLSSSIPEYSTPIKTRKVMELNLQNTCAFAVSRL